MYHYRAYGLRLASSRALAGLLAGPADGRANERADVTLDFRRTWPDNFPGREAAGWVRRPWLDLPDTDDFGWWTLPSPAGDYHRLAYGPAGDRRLEYLLSPQASDIAIIFDQAEWSEGVESLLLGQVMGCALRLRGLSCLHASVVAVGEAAVAVVGPAKSGKSTFAAAAAQAGLAILSDDLAVLAEPEPGRYLVQPGYPHLRLSPLAVAAFYGAADGLRPVFSFLDKRYVELSPEAAPGWRFQAAPLPLAAVYILGPRQSAAVTVTIRPLLPAAGLLALKEHSYVRFFLTPAMKTAEFALLGRLARHTPVRVVERPEGLAYLHPLCEAIAQDAAALAAGKQAAGRQAT